ncbi:helix-turn-helix domain-containing protein [Butyrivibrio sp. M55]|uniref:helix-turn-helix domain-containing protein n=1 Tax=Butyrivibrio sp. M55 TaxID=1855323 RepID=UPI0008E1EBCD|nr:helix-turn-helix transcriptional regulator [Butyrivibrio sp. M55]SFU66178.1 Transcriptional regulator, contains XRE-family HTH domain [Butyrivibrio sp. M55]
MTIRDRIFDKLQEMKITQKEFAKRTGIAESTISDWRKKNTNPTAEKIMIICKVLDVTPEWLLSGIETHGDRGKPSEWYAIDALTESGQLIKAFNSMDKAQQSRLLGYAEALTKMSD